MYDGKARRHKYAETEPSTTINDMTFLQRSLMLEARCRECHSGRCVRSSTARWLYHPSD